MIFLSFLWGTHLIVVRFYFYLCSQESFLEMLWEPYEVLGIESDLAISDSKCPANYTESLAPFGYIYISTFCIRNECSLCKCHAIPAQETHFSEDEHVQHTSILNMNVNLPTI